MLLNKILRSQVETQLWALKMASKGFRCDDKPIQVRHKAVLDKTATKVQ